MRAVWLHLNTGRATPYLHAFHFASTRCIHYCQIRAAQCGDEHQLSVWRELQPVRPCNVGRERLNYFLGGDVDDGYGTVLGVRGPDFLAIRRNIEAFRASAHAHHSLVPIPAPATALLDHGHGGGTDVRSNHPLQTFENENHVRSVLTRTKHPIDFLRCRVVAANHLGGFSREPDLSTHEHQAVRPTKRAEIHWSQSLLFHQVDHRQRVVPSAAVVGDVGELSIRRCSHFMRIGTGGHPRYYLEARRIDDG